jgi:Protein of unknown function (DUF3501)
MRPIQRNEVLSIGDYEAVRERFRSRVIEEKKIRRVLVGDKASAVFENRDTVLLQIQEMLRTERITREAAVLHEIETYNALIPGKNELSITLMIEITDPVERDTFLEAARGLERHVAIHVGGTRVAARWDPSRELPDRTSAVHYLKFPLSEASAEALRQAARSDVTVTHVALAIDHDAYHASATLPVETILSLGEDLGEA